MQAAVPGGLVSEPPDWRRFGSLPVSRHQALGLHHRDIPGPGAGGNSSALAHTGAEQLHLDGPRASLGTQAQLDLGALGKGWAGRLAVEYLAAQSGITGGILALGAMCRLMEPSQTVPLADRDSGPGRRRNPGAPLPGGDLGCGHFRRISAVFRGGRGALLPHPGSQYRHACPGWAHLRHGGGGRRPSGRRFVHRPVHHGSGRSHRLLAGKSGL